MQHEERESIIKRLVESLSKDLLPKAKSRICGNPYIIYNNKTILDLMADYGVQRRTAKEWLLCAQIRFAVREKNARLSSMA